MYATNFEYDGKQLSDYGMMICRFDSPGLETLSSEADLTFTTTKSVGSDKVKIYNSKYDEIYTAVFQICRLPGSTRPEICLAPNEISALQRWLCRKDGYHPFKLLQEDFRDIYWNAVFSCKQIELKGETVGLELTMYTDSPYACLAAEDITYSLTPGDSFTLFDLSDETGFQYPAVTIVCGSSSDSGSPGQGKIVLQNSMDTRRKTILTNLQNNEIITLDGENKLISSNLSRTDLANSFNYCFPRIFNRIENGTDMRENVFTLLDTENAIPCHITFHYAPIIKIGL